MAMLVWVNTCVVFSRLVSRNRLQYLRRPVELRRASVTLFVEYILSLVPSPVAMNVMLPDPIPVFTSTCLVSVVSVPLR